VANVVILCTQEEIRRIVICAQGIGPQVKLQHKKKKKKERKRKKERNSVTCYNVDGP
jgi:hypothetical protein